MHPVDAARIFHDWAHAHGLLADGPAAAPVSAPNDFEHIAPRNDAALAILRARQVQCVAFDDTDGEVIVFTRKAIPASKRIRALLPVAIDDVAIRYRQGVQAAIGGHPNLAHGGPVYRVRATAGRDRYTCGGSISVGNNRDAGTLGALVRDTAGVLHGLSNNHVSGSCNFAASGLPIVAPGVYDVAPGNLPPFTIGFHTRSLPMRPGAIDNVPPKDNRDAAIFRIADEALVTSYQGDAYDTPSQVAAMAGAMTVEKVGRTTGLTRGVVLGQMYGAVAIPYNAPLYGFSGPVYFLPMFTIMGLGDVFSAPGDSGSLITTLLPDGQRAAVGIVVGGQQDASAPGGNLTLALPIEPTLTALGVTLVSGHNV